MPSKKPKKRSNPISYPITTALRKTLTKEFFPTSLPPLAEQAIEAIGEYEHGSVDLVDVHPSVTLEQYAAVLADFVLFAAHSED